MTSILHYYKKILNYISHFTLDNKSDTNTKKELPVINSNVDLTRIFNELTNKV
jgi:hypothetical protein